MLGHGSQQDRLSLEVAGLSGTHKVTAAGSPEGDGRTGTCAEVPTEAWLLPCRQVDSQAEIITLLGSAASGLERWRAGTRCCRASPRQPCGRACGAPSPSTREIQQLPEATDLSGQDPEHSCPPEPLGPRSWLIPLLLRPRVHHSSAPGAWQLPNKA